MIISARRILTPSGWQENASVHLEDDRIISIQPKLLSEKVYDYLAPGFFDTHTHGGGGFDTCHPEEEKLREYLLQQARNGVTDVALTTSSISAKQLNHCVHFIRNMMEKQRKGQLDGATIRGIHMEGPFLNVKRKGGMDPDGIYPPSVDFLKQALDDDFTDLRMVTIAPEIPGATELAQFLKKHGIVAQEGHSDATWEEAENGFEHGFSSLCHTFNACRPIHHREPGLILSALLRKDVYCEAICDFRHLHPAAIRLISCHKLPDHFCMISDSVSCLGLPDGNYQEGNMTVTVKDGVMTTPEGILTGGTCYLGRSVQNLMSIGMNPEDILHGASLNPIRRFGLEEQFGRIEEGREAHLVAMNEKLAPQLTVIGRKIFEA